MATDTGIGELISLYYGDKSKCQLIYDIGARRALRIESYVGTGHARATEHERARFVRRHKTAQGPGLDAPCGHGGHYSPLTRFLGELEKDVGQEADQEDVARQGLT